MIEVYSAPTPNGWKVTIMLEECGLPYSFHPVDLSRGEQRTPEFLEMSPNGRIPAIRDGDLSLFESGAILHYLAEKSGLFLPSEPRGRWNVLQWLHWQMGGVGPMVRQSISFNRYIDEPVPYAVERYGRESRRLFEVLDRQLEGRDYVCGDASIADFALPLGTRTPLGARIDRRPRQCRRLVEAGASTPRGRTRAGGRRPQGRSRSMERRAQGGLQAQRRVHHNACGYQVARERGASA